MLFVVMDAPFPFSRITLSMQTKEITRQDRSLVSSFATKREGRVSI